MEKIIELLTLMQQDIQGIKRDMQDVKSDICGLKSEMQDVKNDICGLKSDIQGIKSDIHGIKNEMQDVKSDIRGLKAGQDEIYGIVKSLEHAAQVSKAEHDKMHLDIVRLQGDVTEIKKGLNFVEIVSSKNATDIALLKAVR